MAIGQHVRQYQEQKAARAAEEAEDPMDDPKTRMQPERQAEPSNAQVMLMIAQMLGELKEQRAGGEISEALTKQLDMMQQLVNKTLPENKESTGISVFNPEGNANPLPNLARRTVICGHDVTHDTNLKREEIELLNQLGPGDFSVTKANGARIPFKVRAVWGEKTDANGHPVISAIDVWFPCKNEHRSDHMPLTSYMRQALGTAIPTADELMREIVALKAELAKRPHTVGAVA